MTVAAARALLPGSGKPKGPSKAELRKQVDQLERQLAAAPGADSRRRGHTLESALAAVRRENENLRTENSLARDEVRDAEIARLEEVIAERDTRISDLDRSRQSTSGHLASGYDELGTAPMTGDDEGKLLLEFTRGYLDRNPSGRFAREWVASQVPDQLPGE